MGNILFLIGNGFDISLGINTSFSSFIKDEYVNTLSEGGISEPIRLKVLMDKDLDSWSDFENKMVDIVDEYDCLDEYSYDIQHFLYFFKEHLRREQNRLDFAKIEKASLHALWGNNFDKVISHHPCEFGLNQVKKVRFVNFNYTSTIDEILNVYKYNFQENPIIHIHGSINTYPLLGFDQEKGYEKSKIQNDKILINTLEKVSFRRGFFRKFDDDMQLYLNTADVIFSFGIRVLMDRPKDPHPDKAFWKQITELMLENTGKILIVNVRSTDGRKTLSESDRIQNANNFFDFVCANNLERVALKGRIKFVLNSPIFSNISVPKFN